MRAESEARPKSEACFPYVRCVRVHFISPRFEEEPRGQKRHHGLKSITLKDREIEGLHERSARKPGAISDTLSSGEKTYANQLPASHRHDQPAAYGRHSRAHPGGGRPDYRHSRMGMGDS